MVTKSVYATKTFTLEKTFTLQKRMKLQNHMNPLEGLLLYSFCPILIKVCPKSATIFDIFLEL